ncbi:MAG: SUMF1/EgtB/PvdO family nonheme iron enzyme [Bryobacteraceae bacterium]|jgi:formylglycine-generating enzyme required for sulfatase activity/energy-coupling factor transporter ATP-binding protein EcfA2
MRPAEVATLIGIRQPYPGLRPFQPDEAVKFYGRETHTAELLRRLAENRFLAVVGNSGSGKSSLVRAGLLPALHRGRLIGATSQWRICIMRPGDAPMKSLAAAVAEQNVFSDKEDTVLQAVSRSALGLARAVRESQFPPGESLLLVVDQFEELFRFVKERREQDGGAEARLFVASLLEAAEFSSAPVYVVLTMRSDFLGDCSQFPGLPEALNRSQYLVPRMTREQVRDAIEKPLRLVGAHMSARLVERLLNELGDDTGRLPVLQHALNRTFHEFEKRGGEDEIAVADYAAAGEMEGALNAHAEALLSAPGAPDNFPDNRWEEDVFRCLTILEAGRAIRRPTRLDHMFEIVGAGDEESQEHVRRVIGTYSDPEHAMLFWSGKTLTGESVVDIAHESLIEHWQRLKRWVGWEAEAARLYQSAAHDAVGKRTGAAAQWRGKKLSDALGCLGKGPWNQAWATRLLDPRASFAEVKTFIESEASAQRTEEQENEAQRARELEAAKARAAAEAKAREAAERAALAEGRAREAAEQAAQAETRAREAAETRATAEERAKKAAESLAMAERQKKRWISAASALGLVLFGIGLWWAASVALSLKLGNSEADLHKQIAASDDILKQYARQELDLRNQVSRTADPSEKNRLGAKLADLLSKRSVVQQQRNAAEAKLSAESKRRTRVNPVDGLTYVFIPPGAFTMGCSTGDDECRDNEKPPHAEQIANGFWLGQTEVTQAAWKKVMNDNPSYFKSDQLPVEEVDWTQASKYCQTIGGTLPTEKEWEYAARGGTAGPRYGPLDAVAWYNGNSGGTTHPVGLKQPNAYGLYDMLGNVWEWTADNYDAAGNKVIRGGSWLDDSWGVRASFRDRNEPTTRNYIGFRCVGEFR